MTKNRPAICFLGAAALAALALAPDVTAGQRKVDGDPGVPRTRANLVDGLLGSGTQVFDNDTPFRRDGTDGGTVGNRFQENPTTAAGPVHSIASVSFAVAGNFSTSMVMTVWDVNATNVQVLHRELVSGIAQSPAATARFSAVLSAPIVGHSGSFIAGLRNTDYDTCAGNMNLASTCDGVALTQGDAGTSPPPFFQGARVNFNSGAFVPTILTVNSTGQDLGNLNAIFRVTGDNLPVELMRLSVE